MKYALFIFALFAVPVFAHAAVSITEVAWMGVEGKNGQYGEWVELYNDANESVDLSGWKINKTGDKLLFLLSKSIPANGYLLVERKTASVPDPVPGVDDELVVFSNSGLSNTGEDLVLIDNSGAEIQRLSFASKWPAGSAETSQTMQWNGDAWITDVATPKKPALSSKGNDPDAIPALPGTSQSKNQLEGDTPNDNIKKKREIIPPSPNKPYIAFDIPKTTFSGIDNIYEIHPVLEYNYQIRHGVFNWNFGDGTTAVRDTLESVAHTYKYSGTYTISFSYAKDKYHDASVKGYQKIEVIKPSLVISVIDGSALKIENKSQTMLDLTGFKVLSGGSLGFFPPMTILGSKSTITIAFQSLMIEAPGSSAEIIDPYGSTVIKSN